MWSIINRHYLVLLVLCVTVVLVGILTSLIVEREATMISKETQQIFAGSKDSITYTDMQGVPISLEDFLGRILVVTTWASWSPYSQADLEAMNEVASKYSEDDVVFLAMNRMETKEQAQRFASTLPKLERVRLILDHEDFFYRSVDGYAVPETVVFDQRGQIVEHIRGIFDTSVVESRLTALLETQ